VRRALTAPPRTPPPRAPPAGVAGARDEVTILLVSAWGMGGTIRAALNLAGYLADHRDVEIISVFRKGEEPFFGAFPPGVKVTALDDRRDHARPKGARALLYALLRNLPSVLIHPADRSYKHSNLWSDLRLARALRGRRGYLIATRPGLNFLAAELSPPGLVTIGQEQMHLLHHRPALRKTMPELYPRLDGFVVLTAGHKEQYDELLKGRGHVVAIPNTVRQMPGPKADLSAKTIFTAGRLVDQKGFDLLLRAFAPVAADHPDWRLRICGHGQRRGRLAKLIEKHGLADSVSLEPPARQIGDDMAAASVFALSSRFEGFPLILLEAMSKEMAVVAFDCPTGPGEIVDDHRNGLLIPEKDVEAFGAGLREMIEDEELRRRCGPAAGETAQRYTMQAIGPRWDELLADLGHRRLDGAAPQLSPGDGRYAVGGGDSTAGRPAETSAGRR
jgi:glycosyltransferase involved in cell wall biosynthesis